MLKLWCQKCRALLDSVPPNHGGKSSISSHVATATQRRYIFTRVIERVVVYVVQVYARLFAAIDTDCAVEITKKPSGSVAPSLCARRISTPIRVLASNLALSNPFPGFPGALTANQGVGLVVVATSRCLCQISLMGWGMRPAPKSRTNLPLVFFREPIHYAYIW